MILDRSGSMETVRSDVVGGFNKLLEEQKALPGDCTITLVQFDSQDPYEILRDFVPVNNVMPLGDEYRPRGNTPLYDAVGRGIVNLGEKLKALTEDRRPAKVVFVIITDGLENASEEYNASKVSAMVKEQTEKYKWEFVYLGANQDAILEGGKFGAQAANAATYKEEKTSGGILAASENLRGYRSGAKSGMSFTDKQRKSLAE